MIYTTNVNIEINLKSVEDLSKLKILIEVNNLDKPNFSAIARDLGIDRRTAKKYYDGNIKIINLIFIDIWLEKRGQIAHEAISIIIFKNMKALQNTLNQRKKEML